MLFFSVPEIEVPLPAMPPVNPGDMVGAVHENWVSAGTLPLVPSAVVMVNDPSLQMFVVIGLIAADGFTNTSTVNGVPAQPLVTGVTV